MREEILTTLESLEREMGFHVLLAVESGSRAWGFASRDSDWDVRFVYAWPLHRYLEITSPAETLERLLPRDLDVSGWDLRKALHHLGRSNASLLEWFESPLVYRADGLFVDRARQLARENFQPRRAIDHYLGIAKSLASVAGDGTSVQGKAMLYVLRATLAAEWILKRREIAPVPLEDLLSLVPETTWLDEIHAFVETKRNGRETDELSLSSGLIGYVRELREEIARQTSSIPALEGSRSPLDHLFRSTLEHLKGPA